jgi:hypothetical protein
MLKLYPSVKRQITCHLAWMDDITYPTMDDRYNNTLIQKIINSLKFVIIISLFSSFSSIRILDILINFLWSGTYNSKIIFRITPPNVRLPGDSPPLVPWCDIIFVLLHVLISVDLVLSLHK